MITFFFGDSLSDLNAAVKFDIDFVGIGQYIKKYIKNSNHFQIENFRELY